MPEILMCEINFSVINAMPFYQKSENIVKLFVVFSGASRKFNFQITLQQSPVA